MLRMLDKTLMDRAYQSVPIHELFQRVHDLRHDIQGLRRHMPAEPGRLDFLEQDLWQVRQALRLSVEEFEDEATTSCRLV